MQNHDSIRYYDHHVFRLQSLWLKEKNAADLVPFLEELKPNSRVLDLGCGNGMDLTWIKKAGHQGVGVEGSGQMVEMAKTMNPDLEILNKNLLFLSLKENEFDGVWVNETFKHFSSEIVQRMIATCFRGLKPGGVIGIVVQEGSGMFEDREGDLLGPSRSIYLYTEKALCSMLDQTGFQIIKVGRKTATDSTARILVLASRI
jgi:SAM-dependent methyltransferase